MKERAVCVVVPAYNNAGTVVDVARSALEWCDDVIVVNDGSTDDTAQRLADVPQVVVIAYERNRGKGYALRKAFLSARSQGFAYAVTIDADGQFYAKDIPAMLAANIEHPGALIVGRRRFGNAKRTKGSRFANRFSDFWFRLQTGRRLDDTQSGFRLYPLRRLSGLRLMPPRYEGELAMLVFASWHGTDIVTTDVDVYYPPAEERVSHFRPAADFARISVLNTVLCLLAVVYGAPLRLLRFCGKWLRTGYAAAFFAFFALVIFAPYVWLLTHIGAMNERKRRHLHRLIHTASRFVMMRHGVPGTRFGYKVAPETRFDKPRVIICNHQSHLDIMCQMVFSPDIIFLTNNWAWNNPFYGLLIRNAEFLSVRDGIDALIPQLRSLVERGYSIAVYPEGTRSSDGTIQRFHRGAFYIARQLNLEVLPMYLYGTGRVLKKKSRHLNKSRIYIEVDRPLTQEEMQRIGDTRAQAAAMHRRYEEKYAEIANIMDRDA